MHVLLAHAIFAFKRGIISPTYFMYLAEYLSLSLSLPSPSLPPSLPLSLSPSLLRVHIQALTHVHTHTHTSLHTGDIDDAQLSLPSYAAMRRSAAGISTSSPLNPAHPAPFPRPYISTTSPHPYPTPATEHRASHAGGSQGACLK